MHGYDIIRKLEQEFSAWEPKTGTIYPALSSLRRKGLIKCKIIEREGISIKEYKVTMQGIAEIQDAFDQMKEEFKFIDQYFDFLERNILEEEKKLFREVLKVLK